VNAKRTPLYESIANEIRARIEAGLVAGDRLPTEKDLVAEHGTTRTTVRQAYDVLIREGRVERRPDVGYFVRDVQSREWTLSRPQGAATVPTDAWRLAGGTHQIVTVRTAPGSHEVRGTALADLLDLGEPHSLAGCRSALRYLDNQPACISDLYLPYALVKDAAFMDEAAEFDAAELLAASGWRLAAFVDRIATRTPTPQESDRLELPQATPVLELVRVEAYAQDDGEPVCLTLTHAVYAAPGAELVHAVHA
jgi:GntR family transcriptional regulator